MIFLSRLPLPPRSTLFPYTTLFRSSGKMTGALVIYSATFMRYSMAVTPKNYLLFACHFINEAAQLTQGYRYLQYWKCVDRKSTRLNSSHRCISYAVFCLKKTNIENK